MKLVVKIILFLICSISFAQTNLLDTSSWFEGSGSVAGFTKNGTNEENIREMGIGPHNSSVLLWKTIPSATGNTGAGGWKTDLINIDPSKTYRFSVWIKKTNSNDGATYFRAKALDITNTGFTANLNNSYNANPFFWSGDPPTLDTWYLLVGYMHKHTYTTTASIGGVYNGSTGVKMLNTTDYKFQSGATHIQKSIWLSNNTNTSDSQFYYGPTIYEVNGQEPSIEDLINAHPDDQVPSKPTVSNTTKTDTTVDLSWTAATDNIAVTGYKVYKGGALIATLGNVLTYQVTGLTATTAYSFTVTALDAAGNESIASNTLNITTNSTPVPATNLLDTSGWTIGNGSASGFTKSGTDTENIREMGIGPHGLQKIIWKSEPADDTGGKRGWTTDYVNIDHSKTYRYTSWVKKTSSKDGTIYLILSCKDDINTNTALNLNGSVNGAPYPYSSDPQHLDQWYLLVGYIHHSGYNSTTSIGGVYDTNGVKQSNMTDYKFSNAATRLKFGNFLWFSSTTNHQMYTYAPTIYEANGQEPTIQELINAQPSNPQDLPTTTGGHWNLNNQDIYYNTGNVGIGTSTPDEALAVNGNIHAKEVRVDLNNWPDYVFTKDHDLPSLKAVENHIQTKGYLPNIPSAKEVEENGIQLGEMNKKLLEKIEELTLYILQLKRELEVQKEQIKNLEKNQNN